MKTRKRKPYLSYLLRIWQETEDGVPLWRASLESAQTGHRQNFVGLDALFAYLHKQINMATKPQTTSETKGDINVIAKDNCSKG